MPRYFVLSLNPPFRQIDGFFVREDGEVCYWPPFSRVGHVVPSELLETFREIFRSIRRLFFTALFLSVVLVVAARIALAKFPIPIEYVVSLFIFPAAIAAFASVKWLRIFPLLNDFEKIRHLRPPAIDSILKAKAIATWLLLLSQAILWAFAGGLIYVGLFDNVPWIARAALVGFAGVLVWLLVQVLKRRRQPLVFEDHVLPGHEWFDESGRNVRSYFTHADDEGGG